MYKTKADKLLKIQNKKKEKLCTQCNVIKLFLNDIQFLTIKISFLKSKQMS